MIQEWMMKLRAEENFRLELDGQTLDFAISSFVYDNELRGYDLVKLRALDVD